MFAPLVKTEQNGSVGVEQLAEVIVRRTTVRLAKERLVPLETGRHILNANDCPNTFQRIFVCTGTIKRAAELTAGRVSSSFILGRSRSGRAGATSGPALYSRDGCRTRVE
jgi:hypothetical protein